MPIHKYELPACSGVFKLSLPVESEILSASTVETRPSEYVFQLWARLPGIPSDQLRNYNICVCNTGDAIDVHMKAKEGRFIDTISLRDGNFTLHVFEMPHNE